MITLTILSVSVQFSCSDVSNSLWPHELQHVKLLCSSWTSGAYINSCPSSQWCHPAISSSVVPFSSHLQSFPASGSFQISQSFASGGQSIGASASVSVLQWIFRFDFLAVQGTLKSLLQHHSSKASILWLSTFLMVQLSHQYMTTGKTIASTIQTFVSKVMSLLSNMLFRFVTLPRSKCLLISWLQPQSILKIISSGWQFDQNCISSPELNDFQIPDPQKPLDNRHLLFDTAKFWGNLLWWLLTNTLSYSTIKVSWIRFSNELFKLESSFQP